MSSNFSTSLPVPPSEPTRFFSSAWGNSVSCAFKVVGGNIRMMPHEDSTPGDCAQVFDGDTMVLESRGSRSEWWAFTTDSNVYLEIVGTGALTSDWSRLQEITPQ